MAASPIDGLTAIANAIEKVAELLATWISGEVIRKYKYRIEAAVNFVFVVYKEGQYADLSEERKKELMLHFRKRIFDE